MKILLLGSTGLLGQAVKAHFMNRGHTVLGASRSGSDIRIDIGDELSLMSLLSAEHPDAVINCAALVDVERCETEQTEAWAINARPLIALSDWSMRANRPLLHVSTDQFFVGDGRMAHSENHPVTLLNVYAKTKFVGEQLALASQHAIVLRTAIVGIRGWQRPTLAEWALDAVLNNRPVRLFKDAYTSAIDVGTFAQTMHQLLADECRGLYNIGAKEVYSKADFVLELARQLNVSMANASLGSVSEMAAIRADSLGLDVAKIQHTLSREMPTLAEVIGNVIRQHKEGRTI